jgi:Putative phage metallopeptidase
MRKPKPKPVSYELIAPDGHIGEPMYELLAELVTSHHEDLEHARIALAWCTSWKPDVDGRVTLGKCKKASDLDRELSQWDFIILLRKSFWTNERVTLAQRRALLDHELCHAAVKLDGNGEPVEDERGRRVYRLRKHDIEEFVAIVERHGLYVRDLEMFAAAIRRSVLAGFKPCELCRHDNPGWTTAPDNRLTRCACWLAWTAQYAEATEETVATL